MLAKPYKMRVDILNVKIDNLTSQEVTRKIEEFLNSRTSHYIITANPEILVVARKDGELRRIIGRADLVVPDGFGLLLASKFLSPTERLSERIAGIDLVYKIVRNFDNPVKKNRIFFLGSRGETAKLAAMKLKKNFPNFEIAGTFGGEAGEEGDRVAISIINQAKPDILLIAYGAPKQEKWIARNLKKMPSVKLAIGVGGAFDIISGKISRAPLWMRNAGLEWLWRFTKEPQRIGRIYNATIKFVWLVMTKNEKRLHI